MQLWTGQKISIFFSGKKEVIGRRNWTGLTIQNNEKKPEERRQVSSAVLQPLLYHLDFLCSSTIYSNWLSETEQN